MIPESPAEGYFKSFEAQVFFGRRGRGAASGWQPERLRGGGWAGGKGEVIVLSENADEWMEEGHAPICPGRFMPVVPPNTCGAGLGMRLRRRPQYDLQDRSGECHSPGARAAKSESWNSFGGLVAWFLLLSGSEKGGEDGREWK